MLFESLLSNKILIACIISWFTAQILKVIIVFATESRVDFRRMIESGGMLSSHSSLVCTLATCVGTSLGFQSAEFAISFVVAAVVMYDASNIRRAAGQHAAVLNKLIASWKNNTDEFDNIELKELLGHTPLQVLMGAMLGVAVALLV